MRRAIGAKVISPGQRPGIVPSSVRPEGAKGSCAPSGRTMIVGADTRGVAPG